MELQHSIEIERPQAEVFRFIATDHATNHPRWDPGIIDMRQVTSGPVGVGTEFTFARKMMGKNTPMRLRVTEHEENRKLTFVISGPMDMTMHMELEPIDATRTRLAFHGEGHLPGLMRLMEPMVRNQMGKEIAAAQGRIKAMLEAKA